MQVGAILEYFLSCVSISDIAIGLKAGSSDPKHAVPHERSLQGLQEAYAEIWKLRERVSRKD
jgi:hypothetical protein